MADQGTETPTESDTRLLAFFLPGRDRAHLPRT